MSAKYNVVSCYCTTGVGFGSGSFCPPRHAGNNVAPAIPKIGNMRFRLYLTVLLKFIIVPLGWFYTSNCNTINIFCQYFDARETVVLTIKQNCRKKRRSGAEIRAKTRKQKCRKKRWFRFGTFMPKFCPVSRPMSILFCAKNKPPFLSAI